MKTLFDKLFTNLWFQFFTVTLIFFATLGWLPLGIGLYFIYFVLWGFKKFQ